MAKSEPSLVPEWLSRSLSNEVPGAPSTASSRSRSSNQPLGLSSAGSSGANIFSDHSRFNSILGPSGGSNSSFSARRGQNIQSSVPGSTGGAGNGSFSYRDSSGRSTNGSRPPPTFERSRNVVEERPPAVSLVGVKAKSTFDKNFPALGNNSPWKSLAQNVTPDSSKSQAEKATVWGSRQAGEGQTSKINGTVPRPLAGTISPRSPAGGVAFPISASSSAASKPYPVTRSSSLTALEPSLSSGFSINTASGLTSSPSLSSIASIGAPPPVAVGGSSASAAIAASGYSSNGKITADTAQLEALQKLIPRSSSFPKTSSSSKGLNLKPSPKATVKSEKDAPSALLKNVRPATKISPQLLPFSIGKSKAKEEDVAASRAGKPQLMISPEEQGLSSPCTSAKSEKRGGDSGKGEKLKWLQQLRSKDVGDEREKNRSPDSEDMASEPPQDDWERLASTSPDADSLRGLSPNDAAKTSETEAEADADSTALSADIALRLVSPIQVNETDQNAAPANENRPQADAILGVALLNAAVAVEQSPVAVLVVAKSSAPAASGEITDEDVPPPTEDEEEFMRSCGWSGDVEPPLTEEEKTAWLRSRPVVPPRLRPNAPGFGPLGSPRAVSYNQANGHVDWRGSSFGPEEVHEDEDSDESSSDSDSERHPPRFG